MDNLEKYFLDLKERTLSIYKIAREARYKGLDPVKDVEIPIAENMAQRVEGLISAITPQIKGSGVAQRIQELEEKYNKLDWRVALEIALEVAHQKFCPFKDQKEAMEVGIKTGFAYATSGVVSSPLEGFVELKFNKRKDDGKEYFCLYYSGPVRSAGGTGASISVLIADYIRKNFGYAKYDATPDEIKRGVIECLDYHEKVTNLQYFPSEDELIYMIKNLPVQISGDPSEKFEVSNYKDLERVGTNRIRNGFCLVIAECLCQKSPKLQKQLSKWGKDFGMDDWVFINEFVELQKRIKAKSKKVIDDTVKIRKDYTFIKDIVAGRPVISQPSASGGFRVRYGRSRFSGFAALSINPNTMFLLNNYVAVGTQLKYERPGKSTVVSPCDSINGPIVKLYNGDVLYIENTDQAKELRDKCQEILYLGDILINHGEFLNRAHILVPVGYCEEWWVQELFKYGKDIDNISLISGVRKDVLKKLMLDPIKFKIEILDAFKLSKSFNIPFHPRYIFYWSEVSPEEIIKLLLWLSKSTIKREDSRIILTLNSDVELKYKKILEVLGIPHKCVNEYIVIEGDNADALMINLGFFSKELEYDEQSIVDLNQTSLSLVNKMSEVIIRDKSGTFVGARMGRPEKAKLRKLTGSPHMLFPVGTEGDRLRSLQETLNKNRITADFSIYFCGNCNKETIYPSCELCLKTTQKRFFCKKCNLILEDNKCRQHGAINPYKLMKIEINHYFKSALQTLKISQTPALIKGVRGTSNKDHIPENLVKGILRAIHEVYVNKDGTIRYDMTEMPMTHFKPKEIGTPINKLKELGYTEDIYGNKLIHDDQLLEIKPQDILLPTCPESGDEGADSVFFRVGNFVDDLLEYFYGLPRFYNFKKKEDLIGHLVIGLAPHTSAGILARVIGFIKTQGVYAHFMWHAAQRRDCDGDETCCMLLLEALLNFSREYLPAHRGSTQDAPLVLSTKLIPSEVDEQILDVDLAWSYPLELYESALQYKQPWEVKIERVADRLNTNRTYSGFGFTHSTEDINNSVRVSAYKYLETMMDKVRGQMDLAERIRAVNEHDVARLLIERHFIRDIKGNLRQFSTQQFRCVKCNEKYRRPPLIGICTKCGNRLLFTVTEGSIVKYLEPSMELATKYNIPTYLKQSLELTKMRIESTFGKDKEKQEGLVKWFGNA